MLESTSERFRRKVSLTKILGNMEHLHLHQLQLHQTTSLPHYKKRSLPYYNWTNYNSTKPVEFQFRFSKDFFLAEFLDVLSGGVVSGRDVNVPEIQWNAHAPFADGNNQIFNYRSEELKSKGYEEIICISVNDPYVLSAWGWAKGADGKVPSQFHPTQCFFQSKTKKLNLYR